LKICTAPDVPLVGKGRPRKMNPIIGPSILARVWKFWYEPMAPILSRCDVCCVMYVEPAIKLTAPMPIIARAQMSTIHALPPTGVDKYMYTVDAYSALPKIERSIDATNTLK
jgi:hypothetical protein